MSVEEYIKCENGTYCPLNSEEPTLCPNGTFGNGNPNNYNADVSCVPCSAGTYSTTDEPGFCFPCPAGYVCLGQTTTPAPQTAEDDNGYPCPKGYYCPEGSSKELPCPAGTYSDVFGAQNDTDLGCKPCAAGTYNDKEGQSGCRVCGGTSTSVQGATECTCLGVGRERVNGQCLCGQNYRPADGGENTDSEYNCELFTFVTCAAGQVPDITGTSCMSEAEYCSLECAGQGDGTGVYIEQTRKCECTTIGDYDEGCAAEDCTNNNYVVYDCDGLVTVYDSSDAVVTTAYDPSTIPGVFGSFVCERSDCRCVSESLLISEQQFQYNFAESTVATRLLRNLGHYTEEEFQHRMRRSLQTTTTITNPVTCITANNMIEFNVDSSTKSYPVYMKDSLLNTNSAFDYSGFLNLATTIETGTSTVATYVHTFSTAGTYVFMNSLDNYQQTIIKVVAATASCPSTSVSAATLASLYTLNMSTVKETADVNMTFFLRLIATKIGLLVLLVGFVTYMHSLDKNWTIFPWLKKKKDEEEEEALRREKAKKERLVRLKAQELKEIRDDIAAHVERLKQRIVELEKARLKKMKDAEAKRKAAQTSKLLETLRILKKDIKKRAKLIRNENGFDFEKDKQEMLIKKKFSSGMNEDEIALQKLKKKKEEEDDKYNIADDLKNQMDEEIENQEFDRLNRAQEDTRQQVSNYFDEERKRLEDRLRSEGKLNEYEIENILENYDDHTRDMAQMMMDDERRQQENFKRQLDARKNRRKGIYDDIDKLKQERQLAKEIEKKELESHFKKMKEEEDYVIGKLLVEEERGMRKEMEKDLEKKKNDRLKQYVDKMKNTKDKDEFKKVLSEYNEKLRGVEDELNNVRKRALMDIERKIAERKTREKHRIAQMKPEKSSVDIKAIEDKIEAKMDLLKKEADGDIAVVLDEERRKRNINQELAMLRKQNDEQIRHLRELHQEEMHQLAQDLNEVYDDKLQVLKQDLADSYNQLKRVSNPEEKKEIMARIEDLKGDIDVAQKEAKKASKDKKGGKGKNEK